MSSREVTARDVELCQQGDRAALDRVLRAYSADIQATVSRLYGWGPDGKDVMQRALVTAVKAFPTFRGDSSVKTWLVGIAVNTARDARRRRGRRAATERPADEVHLDEAPVRVTPEQRIAARDLLRQAETILNGLNHKLRETYILHVVLGYSVRETALALNVPELTVKSRTARTRQQIARALDERPELQMQVKRRADGG